MITGGILRTIPGAILPKVPRGALVRIPRGVLTIVSEEFPVRVLKRLLARNLEKNVVEICGKTPRGILEKLWKIFGI